MRTNGVSRAALKASGSRQAHDTLIMGAGVEGRNARTLVNFCMPRQWSGVRWKTGLVLSLLLLTLLLSCFLPPTSSAADQASPPKLPSNLQQRIDEARAKLAQDSLNFHLSYELANALHDAGLREEALFYYNRSLAIEPKFIEALVNKGAVLNELGNIHEAIATFEKALSFRQNDPRALVNSGNSFYALKNYGEALRRYRLAVESDSTFVEAYYYIGIAFADAGIYREAIREWEKIVLMAPNSEAAETARENINALRGFMAAE